MSIVQSIPAGYLSLLGIKEGQNPGQAADFVQPVLSLDTFYLAAAASTDGSTLAGATNPGDVAVITVPTGEAWRLLFMSGKATGASAATSPRLGLQVAGVGVVTSSSAALAVANDVHEVGVSFPQPVVVSAGTRLTVELQNDLGVPTVTLFVFAMFQRLVV